MNTNFKLIYDDIKFSNKNSCINEFKKLINCVIYTDKYSNCKEKYKLLIHCLF